MHTSYTSPKKVDFANTLRGIAALCVLISHYFGVFWLSRSTVSTLINAPELALSTYPVPIYVTYLHKFPLLNFGPYGVGLFFIISGFVIPFSLQKSNRINFFITRIFRIIPIYIVGFSITLLFLFLSTVYFHTPWPYTWKEVFIHYIPGLRDVLSSRNIDGIIWTLEIEVKFYIVCALAITSFRSNFSRIFFIPLFLFLSACYCIHILPGWEYNVSISGLIMAYIATSQYIIFMFIGVVFHYLFCQKIELSKGYLCIASLFTLFCIEWWAAPYSYILNTAWSYGFALLTFMFAYSYPQLFKANRLFNFFADISYPLYVIHGLSGYIALRILLDKGCKIWLALIIVCSSALFLSWILHKFIEQPVQILGKKISANLTYQAASVYISKKISRFFNARKSRSHALDLSNN